MDKVDQIRFDISQLRQDKVIYATEACAINTTCLLALLFINLFFGGNLRETALPVVLLTGPTYTVYMGITNVARWRRIQELEKILRQLSK